MTKLDQKQKIQIPTRTAKPKGDMFANLRRPDQVETVHFEELVAPVEESAVEPSHPNPSQPTPTHPNPPQTEAAPRRDFNRRANSLERDALPAGFFPGTSKKLYDALYLRTRGAVVPTRTIQVTKRELMAWSGIRSKNTVAVNLKILLSVGFLKPSYDPGNHEGTTYEVILPEEISTHPNPSQPIPTQKLGLDPTQLLGWDGLGKPDDSKATSEKPKTSFKTNTERSDDDDAALAAMNATLKHAAKEITGRELSPAESDRWRELADVLVAELKIAAARTTVSSVPSFLAEHLRRRLWKVDKRQARAEGRELPDEAMKTAPSVDASKCPDCAGSGWHYPEGQEKGVKKCRHEKLNISRQNEQSAT